VQIARNRAYYFLYDKNTAINLCIKILEKQKFLSLFLWGESEYKFSYKNKFRKKILLSELFERFFLMNFSGN